MKKSTAFFTAVILIVALVSTGVVAWQMGWFSRTPTSGQVNDEKNQPFAADYNTAATAEPAAAEPNSTAQTTAEQTTAIQNTTTEANGTGKTSAEMVAPEEKKSKGRSESDVWREMHEMANTKIVADEIWGKISITDERVTKLIKEVADSEYKTKTQLLAILEKWREGDFRQAVEDHNYLWNCLDGTIGKATGLTRETADAMASRFGQEALAGK